MPSRPTSEAVPFPDSDASLLLDLLRGAAAVLVLLSHWRALFFVDLHELPVIHRSLYLPFYVLTGAGHQAVILFFVLSGYLVGGSILRALRKRRWSWSSYLIHRLTRLWTVLVPGLLVCLACDWIGIHLGPAPARYFGLVAFIPDVRLSLNTLTFAGNLAFLQTLRVPMFGSDSALWSLAYEFWYYLLFPLALFSLLPGSLLRRIAFGLLALLAAVFGCAPVLPDAPVWLAGVALLYLPPPPAFSNPGRLLAVIFYLPVFFFITAASIPELAKHYLLGAATVALLWILLSATHRARKTPLHLAIRQLSRFSFTLYVVHIPVLMLLSGWLVPLGRWQPTPGRLAFAALPALLTIIFAYALASVTEFHTGRIRHLVERHLGLQLPASQKIIHGSD